MYKVLATYYPRDPRKAWKIGRDICAITRRLGFRPLKAVDERYEGATWSDTSLHAHVRRRTLRSPDGAQWHRDGDYGHVPMDHGLILWSNIAPTEFNFNGFIYQPQPFSVVYIRNLECTHRRPPNAPRNRYIFRQRVE
jgi:hypothetical protein